MRKEKKRMILCALVGIAALVLIIKVPVVASILNEILTPDPFFGDQGRVTTDIVEDIHDTGKVMAFQRDGKIVMAGESMLIYGGCEVPYTIEQSYVSLARYSKDGVLDTSFGQNGKVTTDFTNNNVKVLDVAVQNDGRILVAGYHTSSMLILRYTENGTLDDTFGENGIVTIDNQTTDRVKKIDFQHGGKILLVGNSNLVRLNPDGSLDAEFAENGSQALGDLATSNQFINAVDVDPHGRILLFDDDPENDITLARYYPNGQRDLHFGEAGKATVDIAHRHCGASVVKVMPDHSIVVGGYCELDALTMADPVPEQIEQLPEQIQKKITSRIIDLLLVRFNTDGTLDRNFGSGGIALDDFGGLEGLIVYLGFQPEFTIDLVDMDLSYGPSGKIWVGFPLSAPPLSEETGPFEEYVVARYDVNGRLDRTFGQLGKVTIPFDSEDVVMNDGGVNFLKIGFSGDIYLGGSYESGFLLDHYNIIRQAPEIGEDEDEVVEEEQEVEVQVE